MDWTTFNQNLQNAVRTATKSATRAAAGYVVDAATPTLRLGVTGLARSGKTVFITALVHALIKGGRLPLFDCASQGRLLSARLEPQPDDTVPRFEYESHVAALVDARNWPTPTSEISELRLALQFDSRSPLYWALGGGRLNLDIVDYPGEWLADLPLLTQDYAAWSRDALRRARRPGRAAIAAPFLAELSETDRHVPEDEARARLLSGAFKHYLRAARADGQALSALSPGRFLMEGDLKGSPALTFAPIDLDDAPPPPRSLAAMMQRRYEAYKANVVVPFFRTHFARLDRQIVLVDMLQAMNAGPAAIEDLEEALAGILTCFRPGRASWLGHLFGRRTIDRILFAATKADLLHSTSHDRLEAHLSRLVRHAAGRAEVAGAGVDVIAMAAVRATREATLLYEDEPLHVIIGTPESREALASKVFDGETEVAVFPGSLPPVPLDMVPLPAPVPAATPASAPVADARSAEIPATQTVAGGLEPPRAQDHDGDAQLEVDLDIETHFVRFRPPRLETLAATGSGDRAQAVALPHIRLDRAIQFLIGDRLQ